MTKRHFSFVLYFGIFVVAYSGFLYMEHIRHQNNENSVVTSITEPAANNGSEDDFTQNQEQTFRDRNQPVRNIASVTNKKLASQTEQEQAEIEAHKNYGQMLTEPSYIYASTGDRQGLNNNNVAEDREIYPGRGNTPLFTQNAWNTVSNTAQALANTDFSTQDSLAAEPAETNLAESDGFEFLPDGSSQEDLFNSQSKLPRVYSIEEYAKADISCAAGYGEASAHAQLVLGLKGC